MEQLSLGHAPPVSGDAVARADDGAKAARLPRWTRQEILVLIQGKRVAENRVRRGRGVGFGSGQPEPKWAAVSSYCRRHGVNRGPVQCRKRWSNLSGDYRKIKEWEAQAGDESESFWAMRNDLRRERRLPGFFDREVYDILDRGVSHAPPLALALAPAAEEVVFDSGHSAAAEEGLFSDFEQKDGGDGRSSPKGEVETVPMQVSGQRLEEPSHASHRDQGTSNEKQDEPNIEFGSTSQDGRKRKRPNIEVRDDETTTGNDLQRRLIDTLEKNSRLVTEQLEAQNNNLKLDRDQRRDQASGFLNVLNKLADALGKIADKL